VGADARGVVSSLRAEKLRRKPRRPEIHPGVEPRSGRGFL
jgi:hypothetical protein